MQLNHTVLERKRCSATCASLFLHCLLFSYLPLVESRVLNGAVWFVQRLKGVAHVFVPQPGLLLIRNAEQFAHLLFDSV